MLSPGNVRQGNPKRALQKGPGRTLRGRPKSGKTTPLGEFAHDLAARIRGRLSALHLGGPPARREASPARMGHSPAPAGDPLARIADGVLKMKLRKPMEAMEIALLSRALVATRGNISAAARVLGMHRKAVERHLIKHGLERQE